MYVCPANWHSQIARLAIHRAASVGGAYTSIIAPAESIAAFFGGGRAGIRAMIHGALSDWVTPPRHVVLVGGFGTADTSVYIIPTWFRPDPAVGFWSTTVPTDDPYVFAPYDSDSIPAISVGRIPAWSSTDLGIYIDKVLTYESGTTPAWKMTSLHVIEDRDLDGNDGTLARAHADSLATAYGPLEQWNFARSQLYGTDANPISENLPIISAWNAGLGYALFYGTTGERSTFGLLDGGLDCGSPGVHDCTSYPCQWTDSLQSNGKTPVLFGLTCGCAYARGTTGQPSRCGSLSQYLLFAPNKGAVSITGPARAMHEIPGYAIAKAWYQAVFGSGQSNYFREPGVVLRAIKQQVTAELSNRRTEILEMTALGDPALQFFVGGEPVVAVEGTEAAPPSAFVVRQLGQSGRAILFAADLPRAGEYLFTLFDVQGREIGRQSILAIKAEANRRESIEPAVTSPGVYFLRGQGAGLVSFSKFIVLR